MQKKFCDLVKSLTLKTFSAMASCGKFHWNRSTKWKDISSRGI